MYNMSVKPVTIKAPPIKEIGSLANKPVTPEITNWGKDQYKPGKASLIAPQSMIDPVISTPALKSPPKAEMSGKVGFDRSVIVNLVKTAHEDGLLIIANHGLAETAIQWVKGYGLNE